MILKLSKTERILLRRLEDDMSQILIFGSQYPSMVTFLLCNGEAISISAKGVDLAPRFEVFPLVVSEKRINAVPRKVIDLSNRSHQYQVSILRKSEWDVPSTIEERAQMLGESHGSTTQYEGKLSDIPNDATNRATLDVGIEIRCPNGWLFWAATSMFPFSLYVSECEFSEDGNPHIYDRIGLLES